MWSATFHHHWLSGWKLPKVTISFDPIIAIPIYVPRLRRSVVPSRIYARPPPVVIN